MFFGIEQKGKKALSLPKQRQQEQEQAEEENDPEGEENVLEVILQDIR
jgi:hypothetical protein